MPHSSRKWIICRDNKFNKKCITCDREFPGMVALKLHIRKIHHGVGTQVRKTNARELICGVCKIGIPLESTSCQRCNRI